MIGEVLYSDIRKEYDTELAKVIRSVLKEYNAAKEGTIYTDTSLDFLSETFLPPSGKYFVAIKQGKILGGAGINPLAGESTEYCELQRMFLLLEARGMGIGKKLMEKCLAFAKAAKYKYCYIETMENMKEAIHLYTGFGFREIPEHLGETGHFSCGITMLKTL